MIHIDDFKKHVLHLQKDGLRDKGAVEQVYLRVSAHDWTQKMFSSSTALIRE
jgi:hypothetical protein